MTFEKADDPADVDRPERDTGWDDQARKETPTQRLDRNWGDLLQELRVVQTGVQLLTGFLLTPPFQARSLSLVGLWLLLPAAIRARTHP